MKNIQVIDGADNCTYDIFAASEEDFAQLFPATTDVEFVEDLIARLGEQAAGVVLARLWKHPVPKKEAQGIHGTLFFELEKKKGYYPTKKESEMVVPGRRR